MPSKGITVYSYIGVEGYTIEFTVPKQSIVTSPADNFHPKPLEVESHNIEGIGKFTGRFEWKVFKNGNEQIATGYNDVNALTGGLEGGTMLQTAACKPVVTDEVVVAYGFYDAGHGQFGLTNRHQCYVTVSSKQNESWMGNLAPRGSPQAQKPFSRFALAAPHDNGMNSMQSFDAVVRLLNPESLQELRKTIPILGWFSEIPDKVLFHMLSNIVYGLAITQKKDIEVMLTMGARYFEYRPGKLLPLFQQYSKLPADKFYFQHACIPGLAFEDFLAQQVSFLDAHPDELVIIHIRGDGIVKDCIRPTAEEVQSLVSAATSKSTTSLTATYDSAALHTPIDTLRTSNTRLIILTEAPKYDSYTDAAYATLHAAPIIAQFESMSTEGQEASGADLTILQCQATASNIKEVVVYSVVSADAATSCLMATKAELDAETLPWIRANVVERLRAEKTVVVMNDFIDGATVDTAVELSRRRLEAP